jgi:hypothetical protein
MLAATCWLDGPVKAAVRPIVVIGYTAQITAFIDVPFVIVAVGI